MKRAKWRNEAELAAMMLERAKAGREVRLSPDTAWFVATKLQKVACKPTRRAIALLLCVAGCKEPCVGCIGKANPIVNAYGDSLD